MTRLLVGCLIFVTLPLLCASQTKRIENTTLKYSQLGAILAETQYTAMVFNKVKFVNDMGEESWDMTISRDTSGLYDLRQSVYIASSIDVPFPEGDTTNTVTASYIQFTNCVFDSDLYFEGVTFPGYLAFGECYSTKNKATFLLRNCRVEEYLMFNNSQTPESNPSFWRLALEQTATDSLILYNPGNGPNDFDIDIQTSAVGKYLYLSSPKILIGGSLMNLSQLSVIEGKEQVYISGTRFTTSNNSLLRFDITNSDFAVYFCRLGTPIQ